MATQGDETDEEYTDDPIKLIDFEQNRINTLKKLCNNCQTEDLTDSDVEVVSDSLLRGAPLTKYKRFTLPASFFTISKNLELLNGCRPIVVKVVDCIKRRSYYKKNIRRPNTDSDIIIIDDEINNESVENVCESDKEDCVVILSDSDKEESDISLDEQMGKPKIRPVDITSYIKNNRININNSAQRTSETLKPNEKRENDKGILENEKRIDFKKNKGLVGLRIVQKANVDDRSKGLVGQKIVEKANVDKTKDCSNVEKEKSNKVDGQASQSSKPVHHDVYTLVVSSKSKILDSNTTVKQPESNLSTFNDKHSITNKECLPPNNTNSSKVYKETEKPSNVPEEINLTSKYDKQKSSTDTLETRKKNVEPNKTKNNREKKCISKYFKDVWDKDLRLALEPDTVRLEKLNSSLKYFKDKLKIDKRKNRKENTKRVSNPVKLDTDNDEKANNKKIIEKFKKTKKDRKKSKKKDSIVSDNTKKDSTRNKSMPSLLLDEQIATGKIQIENNISSKSTNKKTSEKLSKNKCMGVKEKSEMQPISNPKNRDVLNEKSQSSCKDSSKLVMNQLATQNKVDKKAERNKNNSERANSGSSIVNYNLKRDVIDKDKPISTSTVNNRINPDVMYKDKTSTLSPSAVNKLLQADKPLPSKPTASQQTIIQNNSHTLNQKQNEDSYNKKRRESENLAKYLFHLQSLNPNLVGGDLCLKPAVKPQECLLSCNQVPKDSKTHTFIGDVQNSSNSTGNNTSSAIGPINSQQIPNRPGIKGFVPPPQTISNNSTNDCNKPDAVKKRKKTLDDNNFNKTMRDLPYNTSSAIEPMNSQQITNQPSNKGLVPPAQTIPNTSKNYCDKPDAVKKSNKTLDDNNFNKISSMRDLPHNTSSAIGPMNSQQIPNHPNNKGSVPPAQTMPNNSENDCNKPDAVKKSNKTLDDNNFNMTSSMQDRSHNTASAIGAKNSQQTPNQPSNKGLIPPAQTMPNNSTNDCNNPDALKKSNKSFDDNMTNSAMQDNTPKSNLIKEIDTATSIKSEVSIKQEDPPDSSYLPPINPRVFENQLPHQARICQDDNNNASYPKDTNSTETQQEPNFPLVAKSDHLHLGNHERLKSNTVECRLNSNINTTGTALCPAQQTANQGRINEEYGKPIEAFVTNRKHKGTFGVAPQVNMKNIGNQNTFPHGVIHCAPIYHGAPHNMPQGGQNQFWVYNPSPPLQGNPISHAQPPMSLPVPQISQLSPQNMSQPLPQMSQKSPKILQHSQQISQLSSQISKSSQQMPPPSTQMLQPSRQMPQPSRQMPQPSQQMPQPSQQMLQPSQQKRQPSLQMPQPSRQMPQSSLQMRQSSQQISRPPSQMSHPVPQMSLPPSQMCHSAPQISNPSPEFRYSTPQMSHNMQPPFWHPPPQMPPQSHKMYHPGLQQSHSQLRMSQPRQQMSNCDLIMSYPQTQNSNFCLCEKCQTGFTQMSNLPPQMMHPLPRMLNRHQEMPHFTQNPGPQMSHTISTLSHTQKQTWNPSQRISNPQSQISHLPQQISNTPPQMSNPPVKYDNAAQSVSGSTIIGRNNAGVVRKINIIAAHAKCLPSSTEAKLNIEDVTPVESEKEMFEELCKITTLESPMKEDSKSKKDLKRQLSKDDKIGESTPNRRPRIGTVLKKINDTMQDLKTSSERALPVPHNGYSPPILPIATFEKTFEILAQANIALFDDGNFGPIKNKIIPILRKRRCLSLDERRDNAKKISIDEYKKRSSGKDNKAIDFVVQHRKVDQNGGQNPDQDLGYDSDTNINWQYL